MNLIDKATIIHYHRHRIDSFNAGSVQALGWRSEDSQLKRFKVLSSIADLNHASILDAGCGYGDFASYLNKRINSFNYIGIDQVPEFIQEAERRYNKLDHIYFFQGDFGYIKLPPIDFIFACGALSYRSQNKGHHLDMIERLFDVSQRAFAFTMLNSRVFPDHPLLIGFDPQEIKSFCEERSPCVELIQSYLPDDFTIVMRKSSKQP